MNRTWWNGKAHAPSDPAPLANRPGAGVSTDSRGPHGARAPAAGPVPHTGTVGAMTHLFNRWTWRSSMALLRISLGVIFFWFGVLKFFPGLSSAEDLATRTIEMLSFGLMKPVCSMPVLAVWECLIGLGLITGCCLRWALLLLFLQMVGTFSPLLLFPGEMFSGPFVPTLEAQYILKNLVFVSAGLVIASSHWDGRSGPAYAAVAAEPGRVTRWRTEP
jgi:uncharacterized membrane protein YphA (DoxX/SURF4 family)